MKGQRGNVLITALFMAIFLFFLSVALISQNRMDISLGLSADHRLKADAAAKAGLDWGLRTMRTDPHWAKTLQGDSPELESGATFKTEVRARSDDSGDPHLLVVLSTGTSGIVSVRHWAVVEEVGKTPEGFEGATQLFTRAWNQEEKPENLAMLGSDFRWYDLGPLPAAENTLEAAGGPLFVFGPPGSAQEPPSIVDFLPLILPETGEQTQGPMTRLELVPPGRHLLRLKIDQGAGEWVDIPDPGPQLGSWAGMPEITSEELKALPVIRLWEDPADLPDDRPPWDRRNVNLTGRGERGNGFEILTVDTDSGIWNEETGTYDNIADSKPWGQVITYSLEEITLDWDTLSNAGLVYLEWYSLTGEALAARGNKIACQGEHFFYGHIPVPGQTFPDLGTPLYESIVFRQPCVLEYDLAKEKWSAVVDLMKVPKKDSPPEMVRCSPWKEDFLEIDSQDRALITVRKRSDTELLRFSDSERYENLGKVPGKAPRVVVCGDQPYFVVEREPWPESSESRLALQGRDGQVLDPDSQLGAVLPGVSAPLMQEGTLTEVQLKPTERIHVGLVAEGRDVTNWGSDLIARAYVRRDIEDLELPQQGNYNSKDPGAITTERTLVTFLRYDGTGWQAWPGGINDLLATYQSLGEKERLPVPSLTGKNIMLCPDQLAIASYVDGYPDLRRYSVIASGKGDPPKLPGFGD